MNRKEVLQFVAWEGVGLAILGAGLIDRINTPTPPFEATSYNPTYTMEYNANYRFRSTILLAVGASAVLAGIPSLFYKPQDKINRN